MVVAESPVGQRAEQRVVLHNVSWDLYEQILAAHENCSAPRFTYDQGELEIMNPMSEHERLKHASHLLVPAAARELGIRVYGLGSTTFKRQALARGVEPDSCFYIQNIDQVRGKRDVNLTVDPPPDLVIEVDVTNPSVPKLPIYAEFGVPEIWRYDGSAMRILILDAGTCVEAVHSRVLPGVSAIDLTTVMRGSLLLGDVEWLDHVSTWAKQLHTPSI